MDILDLQRSEGARILWMGCQWGVKSIQNPADDAVLMLMRGLVPELRHFSRMDMGLFMGMGKMKVQGQGHALESQMKAYQKCPYDIYRFLEEVLFIRHGQDSLQVFPKPGYAKVKTRSRQLK